MIAMLLACLMTSTASLTMAAVIDLATITSPYNGSTVGNSDDISVCGNGPEQGFSYILAPGYGITMAQTSRSFDSMRTLRHGGQNPGEVSVGCIDHHTIHHPIGFTNEGVTSVMVYFIVDASRSEGAGAFTLEWWFYTAGHNQNKAMTNLWSTPRTRQGRILIVCPAGSKPLPFRALQLLPLPPLSFFLPFHFLLS